MREGENKSHTEGKRIKGIEMEERERERERERQREMNEKGRA